jgi:hypothetical protein
MKYRTFGQGQAAAVWAGTSRSPYGGGPLISLWIIVLVAVVNVMLTSGIG